MHVYTCDPEAKLESEYVASPKDACFSFKYREATRLVSCLPLSPWKQGTKF